MVFEHESSLENLGDDEIFGEENPREPRDERKTIAEEVDYVRNLLLGKKDVPANFDEFSVQERHDYLIRKIGENCRSVSMDAAELLPPFVRRPDSGNPLEKPAWLDEEKFRRGQKFTMDHYPSICYAEMCALSVLLSSRGGLETLIMTEQSHTPYLSFIRYLDTLLHFKRWFSGDVWDKGSEAFKSIRFVRRLHNLINDRVAERKKKGRNVSDVIPTPMCPMWKFFLADMKSNRVEEGREMLDLSESFQESMPLNQGSLSWSQGLFTVFVLLNPRDIGIHDATDDDLDAFCHMWRGLGYLLGIEDEYNFCRGNLEEVKDRGRQFLAETVQLCSHATNPRWEHMIRCLFEGVDYYFPGLDYGATLLYTLELMGVEAPNIYASFGYSAWIKYHGWKFVLRYAARLPGVVHVFNYILQKKMEGMKQISAEKHEELQARSAATTLKLTKA